MAGKLLIAFLVSMVPLIELRGGVPIALGMGLPYFEALTVCVIGNMLPVPLIYFFARKVLTWGAERKRVGKFFRFCLEKGERGGRTYTRVERLDRQGREDELARLMGGGAVSDTLRQSAGDGAAGGKHGAGLPQL